MRHVTLRREIAAFTACHESANPSNIYFAIRSDEFITYSADMADKAEQPDVSSTVMPMTLISVYTAVDRKKLPAKLERCVTDVDYGMSAHRLKKLNMDNTELL